jgi:hypothetical protein
MTKYNARMLDSVTGGEGAYKFEHRDDLMRAPADDIVAAFFEYADREVFHRNHVAYELNGVIKNKTQSTVVAIGTMHIEGQSDPEDMQPFTLFISRA